MDLIIDQIRAGIIRTRSVPNPLTKDADVTAEDNVLQDARDRTGSGSSSEESNPRSKSNQAHYCTCSCNCRDKSDKSANKDLRVYRRDIYS